MPVNVYWKGDDVKDETHTVLRGITFALFAPASLFYYSNSDTYVHHTHTYTYMFANKRSFESIFENENLCGYKYSQMCMGIIPDRYTPDLKTIGI